MSAGHPGSIIDSCLAGDHLVAVESAEPLGVGDFRGMGAQGLRAHVRDVASDGDWRSPPDLTVNFDRGEPALSCLDRSAIVTEGISLDFGVHSLDLTTGTWSEISPPGGQPASYPTKVWSGKELIFVPSPTPDLPPLDPDPPGLAYDPNAGTWRETASAGVDLNPVISVGEAITGVVDSDAHGIPYGTLLWVGL